MSLDVGVDAVGLQLRHLGQEPFGGEFFAINSEFLHGLLGENDGVCLVHHGEVLGVADAVDLAAEKFDAEAVDGADEVVYTAAVHHL